MKAIIRERLLECLKNSLPLTERYSVGDPEYVRLAQDWLRGCEESMLAIRQVGLATTVSSQRTRIVSAANGMVDDEFVPKRALLRKLTRAVTAKSINTVIAIFNNEVDRIDADLKPLGDKIAEIVAAGQVLHVIPPRGKKPRSDWLNEVWKILISNESTHAAATLVSSRLSRVDVVYLLDQSLLDLESNLNT